MEPNPKISIIVPVYNAEKTLDRCMQSIYAQAFQDFEIILVNDGSADNSAALCRAYQARDSRVTYIEKENGGAGSARNAGMDAARGDYLAFPDADDWFAPEMYAELYALAAEGDYDMVFSGVNYYTQQPNGSLTYSRTQAPKPLAFADRQQCRAHIMDFFPTTTIFDVPWNKLYKRRVVTDNGVRFTDLRRCQDATFNIDFFNHIHSAAALDKAYYNYMENTAADVQRKFPKNIIDVNIYYYTHLIAILGEWGVYHGAVREHYDSSFVLSVYTAADRYDNPQWGLDRAQQRAYIDDILCRPEVERLAASAQVRDDVRPVLEILRTKNTRAVIRRHRREQRRERLRQSKLLTGIYRKVRG